MGETKGLGTLLVDSFSLFTKNIVRLLILAFFSFLCCALAVLLPLPAVLITAFITQINIKIFNSNDKLVAENDIQSSNYFEFGTEDLKLGTYFILSSFEGIKKQDSFIVVEVAGQQNLENEPTGDGQTSQNKIAKGISSVTGAAVSTVGYITSRPALASIILTLIILGTVIHYSWGFIKNKARGKKPEDTSNLFKDYKFEENK